MRFALLAAALFAFNISIAQSPELVADINKASLVTPSNPGFCFTIGGKLVFAALHDNINGSLMTSDGAEMTVLKHNISFRLGTDKTNAVSLNQTVLFGASSNFDSPRRYGLWSSDGSADGTSAVKEFPLATEVPFNFYSNGSIAYFSIRTASGYELWKSDGTTTGTQFVSVLPSAPGEMAFANSMVFLVLSDATNGKELYTTDGSSPVSLVKDINPGSASATPQYLTSYKNKVFFSAADNLYGTELWASDGTSTGTAIVKDLYSGTSGSSPTSLVVFNNLLYFHAGFPGTGDFRQIMRSDGTASGTVSMNTSGSTAPYDPMAGSLRKVGNRLYFSANALSELWISDGSFAGTSKIRTFGFAEYVDNIFDFSGSAYFIIRHNVTPIRIELWKTGGTYSTTTAVKDLSTASVMGMDLPYLSMLGSSHYFLCRPFSGAKFYLWKSDGTASGTGMHNGFIADNAGSAPAFLTSYNGKTIFAATSGDTGRELYITDYTQSGTALLKDIFPGPGNGDPRIFTELNGLLYFSATDSVNGVELWRTDGTVSGTQLAVDINPGIADSKPGSFFKTPSGKLIFSAFTPASGTELWISDGTASNTVMLKEISGGSSSSSPAGFVEFNGKIIFYASDTVNGQELWVTDETSGGTYLLKDINVGKVGSSPFPLVKAGSNLFFVATSADGRELWKTDGTAQGTVMVKDINPGSASSDPLALYAAGSVVYFSANNGVNGHEPWVSDGTAEGTKMILDLEPGSTASLPVIYSVLNNRLLYQTFTLGYRKIGSIDLGSGSNITFNNISGTGNNYFTVSGNRAYFSATTGSVTQGIFSTDGNSDPVLEFAFSEPLSSIGTLTDAGSLFLLVPTLKSIGSELFRISKNTAPKLDIQSAILLCGDTSASIPVTIFDEDPASVSLSAASSNQSLITDGAISINGVDSSRTILIKTSSDTGTAVVVITAIDSSGNSSTYSVSVKRAETPVVLASSDKDSVCAGDVVTLLVNGCDSCLWSNGFTGAAQSGVEVNTSEVFVVTGYKAGCNAKDSVIIYADTDPIELIIPDSVSVCSAGPVALIASGSAQSFIWNGSVANGDTAYVSSDTVFTVEAKNTVCALYDTMLVSVMPAIQVNINAEICHGESFFAGGQQQTTAGTYTDVYVSSSGCDSTVVTSISIVCNSVWPGDGNYDGVVNGVDFFELALHYNRTGIPRDSIDIVFTSHRSDLWNEQGKTGMNLNHRDYNGDGVISLADTTAVIQNYSMTHDASNGLKQAADSLLLLAFNSAEYAPGETLNAEIKVANSFQDSITGVTFVFTYPEGYIDPASAYFVPSSGWMGSGPEVIDLNFTPQAGTMVYGIVRTDLQNQKTAGKFGDLYLKVRDTVTTEVAVTISATEIYTLSSNGNPVKHANAAGSVTVKSSTPVGITGTDKLFTVYPNPSTGLFRVTSNSAGESLVEVYDILSQRVVQATFTGYHEIDLRTYAPGLYIAKIFHNGGEISIPLVRQ